MGWHLVLGWDGHSVLFSVCPRTDHRALRMRSWYLERICLCDKDFEIETFFPQLSMNFYNARF